MAIGPTEMDDRVESWWGWFTMALYLLIPVDLLTTIVAVAQHGPTVEANPVMRWLLRQGLLEATLVNLLVVVVVVVLFDAAIDAVQRSPSSYRDWLANGVTLWVGCVFGAGLLLTVNNLLVIF